MAKKPTQTSRKSRFELLEDRRLLTTYNVDAKFINNGTADGGETGFGDTATKTAAQLHSTTNNNYGTGVSTVTDNATATSPWTFGTLDSAITEFENDHAPYTLATYVDPNSYDNMLSGTSESPWSPGINVSLATGTALDGIKAGAYGLAGFDGGPIDYTADFYTYGNQGLNGNGSGQPVASPIGDSNVIPTGTTVMIGDVGPVATEFTAPTSGTYTLSTTMSNPDFDPYNGPAGGNGGNDAWTWSSPSEPGGQPDFLIYDVPAASTSAHNTSTLLNGGFYEDVASVTKADLPSVGLSISGAYNSSTGLSINLGTVSQATVDTVDIVGQSYDDTGLPVASGTPGTPGAVYEYGNSGTWTLKNLGPYTDGFSANPEDSSGDQYELTWSVTENVSLAAGDSIQIDSNPRYMQGQSGGDATDPVYLTATVSNTPTAFAAPTVTTSASTGQTFTVGGSAKAVDSGEAVTAGETLMTGATETITNFHSGDTLNFTNQNGITGSYASGVLTLTGRASPGLYKLALDSVTFSTTSGTTGTRTIDVVAKDSFASPTTTSNTGVDTVVVTNGSVAAPVVTTSASTGQTFTLGGTAKAVDSGVTVTSGDVDISGAKDTITNVQAGDTLHFTNTAQITGSYASGVLTLTGSATPSQYTTALESVTFSTTSTNKATRTVDVVAKDSGASPTTTSNTGVDTVNVAISAPVVTTSASTGQTFTLGGTAKAVDSGLTATSSDTDLTSATDTITNFQTGDTLNFTNTAQITGSYASGVLTLTGSATPSQYTAALQSVTFSTTSTTKGTRTVDVVAHDSNDTGNAASNTGVDTVVEVISAPVVTGSHSGNSVTAGELAAAVSAIDPSITVSSHDTDVTGASVTISAGTLKSGDTLNFTNTAQITGSYASGVLTLTGSATPSQYQAALQSVTFSNATNTSTAARSVAFVVQDSNDTGNTNSNTVTETVTVTAPVTITGAYVSGSTWTDSGSTTNFDGYLVDESLGDAAMPIVGYALQTGANQLTQLPWATLTTITVQFSGPVSNIGLGSLKLVGGTGGGVTGAVAAPSVTGFSSSLGSNIYQWTLSSALGNNKYVMAIATTGSSFGTAGSSQVTDANGAGISGTPPAGFTSSSSAFPTGNGLADSTFDFFFNVLPGNGFQNGIDNSSDTAQAKTLSNQHAESGGSPNPTYSAYFDFNGAGSINSVDAAIDATDANDKQSSITPPSAPAAAPVGGTGAAGTASTASTTSITPLALGVIETGSSTSSSSPKSTVGNVVSASTPAVTTSASTGSTVGTGSGSTTSTTTTTHERDRHHHHLAATDEAVSDFDLADLWV